MKFSEKAYSKTLNENHHYQYNCNKIDLCLILTWNGKSVSLLKWGQN